MNNESVEFLAFGRTIKTMTPCGRVFTMREQNGNDDDILSNPVTSKDLTNIDNFLTAILVSENVGGKEIPVTFESVSVLPNNTRYYLLVQSRVHSIGNIIKFEYDFGDDGKYDYEEDLSQYLHDYTMDFPVKGEEGYFPYKIPPYPANSTNDSKFTHTTTGGKIIRFGLMTRAGEKYALGLSPDERTANSDLKARGLEMKTEDGSWIKVENFHVFSKRDMVEISQAVKEIDPTYQFVSEISNPKTGQIIKYPLIYSTSFFYPEEV